MSWLDLSQPVTYWSITGSDENGDPTFAAGVKIDAKWKFKDGVTVDDKGNNLKVTLVIYSETEIPKRSLVVLSDMDAVALPPDDARIVLNVISNPTMDSLFKMEL